MPGSEIERLIGKKPVLPKPQTVALYARVSSRDQKAKGDLDRQIERLREAATRLGLPEPKHVITEVASGLSNKRRGLMRLMELAERGEVTDVVITCKDRLTRFGFRYLKRFFGSHGVTLHLVNGEEERRSLQEELVDDLLAIVTSFSGRLYGLRSRPEARKLVQAVKEAVSDAGDL